MANPQRGGEPLTLNGGTLGALHFKWSGDRYAHHWQFAAQRLITSVESNSTDVWPASPPLQQIHQQSFADGRQVIFGVGMAGRGHWSASFTLVPDLSCWIVELACRSPVEPDALQSTYQLGGNWYEKAEHCFASDLVAGEASRLEMEAIAPASLAKLENDRLWIQPTSIEKAATSQWAFRLRVK